MQYLDRNGPSSSLPLQLNFVTMSAPLVEGGRPTCAWGPWVAAMALALSGVVHPGAATGEDTLVHALLAHCADSLSGIGGVGRPGIVHRLDKETTGVIVVAKTDQAHRALAGAFGGRKPHSVHACVKPSTALRELQAEQERIMQRLGLEPERRKFTPHVTLARMKGVGEPEVAAYLSLRAGFRTAPFPVGRFVLFSSRASKGGGPYLVEEAYPLAA